MVLDSLARLPHQDLLDFGRLAELLGYDRKLNTLDHPVSPRGYRILGRIPRLPKMVVQSIVSEFGGLDEILAAADPELEVGRGRRGHAREGHPRGPSPPAGDQPRGPVSANVNQTARDGCAPLTHEGGNIISDAVIGAGDHRGPRDRP